MGKLLVKDDVDDSMKAKVILEEVYRVKRSDYNLRNACKVMSVDVRNISIPLVTQNVTGQEKVPELEEVKIDSQAYSSLTKQLYKNGAHVALSGEAQMEAKQDIMKMNVEGAAADLARMENKQLAELFDTLSGVAGSDWSDTNDPFDDITSVVTTIRENGFEADTMLMEPTVYGALLSNEEIYKRMERGATTDAKLPSLAGLQIIVDNALTSGSAYILDKSEPCAMLFDGPKWIREYQDPAAFYDGYVIADFLEMELIQPDAGRELTGLLG